MNAQPISFVCPYCDEEKPINESSLEHGIPQFLGGANAPTYFEFSNVCKTCNSNLGLFVDGSFARSWFAGAALQECAMLTYDPNNPHYEIPLICMGISDFSPPNMLNNEVCENWLGPFGESIFLIRPDDERFYWYSGGNPVEAKRKQQRAYFFVSENSPKNFQLALTSFKSSFNKKTKKIMCTTFLDFDTGSIGFDKADELDQARIAFFKSKVLIKDETRKNRLSINTKFDDRFLCKLGFAIAYGLFGDSFLDSEYARELRKGIWHNPNDGEASKLFGLSTSFNKDKLLEKSLSLDGAVVIAIIKSHEGHCMSLSISDKQFCIIKIADSLLEYPDYQSNNFFNGIAYVLVPGLKKHIIMPIIKFIEYKLGNTSHSELDEVAKIVNRNKAYFSSRLPAGPLAAPEA